MHCISTSSKIPLYQRWLSKKTKEIEDFYYDKIVDLTQKLNGIVKIPDFSLQGFSFIKDWQEGFTSSSEVLNTLDKMNLDQAAKAKLTKRLINFMFNNDTIADDVKEVIAELNLKAVPLYVTYLKMLKTYFKALADIDEAQASVTWIQQLIQTPKETITEFQELTINQVIRQIDTVVLPNGDDSYFIGDNIIVFEENLEEDGKVVHWIFAPKNYILVLRELYDVKVCMSLEEESEYIKTLISGYIR